MESVDFEKIGRWLPFFASPLEIEDFCANKILYSKSIPATQRSLALTLAFLREKIRQQLTEGANQHEIIILAKKLLDVTPSSSLATLVALDAFEPLDLAPIVKKEDGSEVRLGTIISFSKVDKKRKVVAKIICDLKELASDAKKERPACRQAGVEVEIPPEEIVVIPVEKDQKINLKIICLGARLLGKKKVRVEVEGGEVGVVIDGRGRPIDLVFGEAESRKKVERWMRVFENKS